MTENSEDNRSIVPSPGSLPSIPPHPLDAEWYVHINSETHGPFAGHRIKQFVAEGRITPETDVMRKGGNDWTDAIADRALAPLFKRGLPLPKDSQPAVSGPVSAAPGATVVQVTNNIGAERNPAVVLEHGPAAPKSAGTALILSILICGLGQIYNGQAGKGILMFFLCIVLWFALLGWIINIWSWIDAYQTASRMNERYYRRVAAGVVL